MFLMVMQVCTIPLDTAKVRLQLQKKAVGDAAVLPKYRGMLGTVATIAREEGMSALWKGIVPGLHRQCLFGGLRIGLYEPVSFCLLGPVENMYHVHCGDNFSRTFLNRLRHCMWVRITLVMFHCPRKYLLHLQQVSNCPPFSFLFCLRIFPRVDRKCHVLFLYA